MSSELSIGLPQNAGPQTEAVQRMACALCRRRKLRCDRQLPCDSCIRLGFECSYENLRNVPVIRKHSLDRADKRPALHRAFQSNSSSETRSRNASKRAPQSPTGSDWSPDQLSQDEMLELEKQFFKTIHLSIPILHQERYIAGITSEPRLRPPNFLRYIVCALGVSVSTHDPSIHMALYRSARRLLEETEYHDGPAQVSAVARPEAWLLVAQYEMLQMQFQRWWMSTARAVRLCQMMGLHVVDALRSTQRNSVRAKDWIELEEQRRVFWTAFVLDRYASFGQGCPMIIDENDVHCYLPSSEEAYQAGTEEPTITLQQALTAVDPSTLTPFAAAISLTAETGHKLKLLQQNDFSAPSASPTGDIWHKINFLNDTLHYAFSIPPHLAASGFKHTPMLTFLHMAAPSSTISLHQAAEEMASAHGITPSSLHESQELRLAAAEMIASTMRLASQVDPRTLHPFTGACLFSASRVFMRSLQVRIDESRKESLKVLLDAMGKLQAVNPLTGGYFKELDKEFPSMRQKLYKTAEATTNSPSLTLSRHSSFSSSHDQSNPMVALAFDNSGPFEQTGPPQQEHRLDHHTMLQQLKAPTTEPVSHPSSYLSSHQHLHSPQSLFPGWNSPEQMQGSDTYPSTELPHTNNDDPANLSPPNLPASIEAYQQRGMFYSEGGYYTS